MASNGGAGSQCTVGAISHGSSSSGSCDEEGSCSATCTDASLSWSNSCNPFENCSAASNGSVGSRCSVGAINDGSSSSGSCDEEGSCSATCTDGSLSWTNNCQPTCNNDGLCKGSETCNNCSADCGAPLAYGGCPYVCGPGTIFYGRVGACVFCMNCNAGDCCGCFIAGTKITLADGSLINIEDVEVGMNVKASSEDNAVTRLSVRDYDGPLFAFNESEDYFVTDSHPFMTTAGWKSMNPERSLKEGTVVTLLEVGDILITDEGEVPITKIKSKSVKTQVYNFQVDGTREYYANGYHVHNKLIK